MLLVAEALVAVLELLNATSGVHDALLAGVEGVRFRGDFNVNHRVGVAVFPPTRDTRRRGSARYRRASEERGTRREVAENDGRVRGVDIGLHWISLDSG